MSLRFERRLTDSRAETKSIASAVRNNVDPLGRCHATRILSAMLLSTHLVNSILAEGYETDADMDTLTKDDLQGLGITKQMHVKKILKKVQERMNEGGKPMTQY